MKNMISLSLAACLATSVTLLSARAQTGDVASQISAQYATSVVFLAISGTTVDGQKEEKTGTGFVVSEEGYVISASHLFEDGAHRPYVQMLIRGALGTSFDMRAPTGIILPLEFVRMNVDVDVGLAKLPAIPTQKYSSVHFCRTLNVRAGQWIHALGFPLGQPLAVNSGTLSSKDGPRGYWKTDILVSEGSSGGPVFDGSGHVIGMIKGGIVGAPGNNFIVPSNLMFDILQTALGQIDDCAEDTSRIAPADCRPKIFSYPIDLTKSDHPSFNPDSRGFTKIFPAEPNYTIESVNFVAASQSKADNPQVVIAPDKSSVRFETTIQSGPFFDQWRGWISGQLVTTQKPKCSVNQ